ncbi:hypothetical protein GCM10007989_11450 [Devosia pacifica]|uniref:Response regulatory domain-containing protein n=1 Tax=Devosia pacifica TaxID=1335967 RepID=A0A918S2Q0_9HYPH|nr:hypothetical protein [Devosia pacifica]GHA17926.1 hypothetical protein GCM10007989_11450 [Devosia pacifica]
MLSGKPTLILEAEYLIALDIQRILDAHNPGEVVITHTAEAAQISLSRSATPALAIVEVRAKAPQTFTLVKMLEEAAVPTVVTTSEGRVRQAVHAEHDVPVLVKPFSDAALLDAIKIALARSEGPELCAPQA